MLNKGSLSLSFKARTKFADQTRQMHTVFSAFIIVFYCEVSCFSSVLLYSKTCVKRPLSKRMTIGFQDQLSQCRSKVLQNAHGEHSAILLTFIRLPFVIKAFVLSIFEWPFYTGFTVLFTVS